MTTRVPLLSDDGERSRDHFFVNRADGDDGLVRTLTPRKFIDFPRGLGRVTEHMRGTEFQCSLAFEPDGIDRDDVLGTCERSTLYGIDTDAADAVHDGDVASDAPRRHSWHCPTR